MPAFMRAFLFKSSTKVELSYKVKKAAILAEGDAADRKDIVFLQKLPLFRKTGDGEYEVIK